MKPNFTFSSANAARRDATTMYVDYEIVVKRPGVLLSLFGYNSGALQYIQFFEHSGAPKVNVTDTDSATGEITAAAHGLHTGQEVVCAGGLSLTAGLGTTLNGYVFISPLSPDVFYLFATRPLAFQGNVAAALKPEADNQTGTVSLVPFHTFAVGAADNFSSIVPVTGINFSHGLVVALSTTPAVYTAGAKEALWCGTLAV